MRAAAASFVGAVLVTATMLAGPGLTTTHAQPSDITHAKELYQSAETAIAEGRFSDAIRDYGAAYEITRDPVLFYKIGSANERAGKCDVAVIYYRRYLREARPSDAFAAMTRERIAACGGTLEDPGAGSGSAGAGSASAGVGSGVMPDVGSGSSAPVPPPRRGKHRVAWLLVGGSLATLTIGAVLAYSANAAESDISDLYIGLGGTPPAFDAKTKARYDDLVSEGEHYQTLSRVSFGIAGALAIGAAIKFATDKDPAPSEKPNEKTLRITPTVSPQGAGVSATVRF